ncbi:MAG: pyridoxamine 5'-phosphate oxidase family protein [Hyphomicrobiales bacterium]
MYLVDQQLKAFLESGIATEVATVDGAGRPHHTPGWGPRICDGGAVLQLFLEDPRATQALSDIAETGRLAVVFADPVTYRSIQLKGYASVAGAALPGDTRWIERHRNAFLACIAMIGDPPSALRNMWMDTTYTRVDVRIEQAFDQTPGRRAGVPL